MESIYELKNPIFNVSYNRTFIINKTFKEKDTNFSLQYQADISYNSMDSLKIKVILITPRHNVPRTGLLYWAKAYVFQSADEAVTKALKELEKLNQKTG